MTQLQQAIAAIKSGDKETGKRLLAWVLHDEPHSEAAWLWMSYVVDDIGQKRDCLDRVLSINPNNEQAQKTLELLDAQSTIAAPELEPRGTIERPKQPFPNLLEQEIKRRTKRGWQLVSHSDTLAQFRKSRQWSGLGILLFVVLPLLVGCVLILVGSAVGIGAFIIAVMGFLFVVADYLLKKDKLVTVTVEELEQQRRQRSKQMPIRKMKLPTWAVVLLVLGAIGLPIAVCLSFRVAPTATPVPTATPPPTWTPKPSPTWTPKPTYTPISTETPIPFDESNLEESYCQVVQAHTAHYNASDLYCHIEETLPTGRVHLIVDITFPSDSISGSEMIALQMRLHKALFTAPVTPGAVDIFTRVGDLGPQQCWYGSGIGYKTQEDYDWEPFDSEERNVLWYQLLDLNQKQEGPGQDQEWLGYADNYPPNCP